MRRARLAAPATLIALVVVFAPGASAAAGQTAAIHWPLGSRIVVWIDPARAPVGGPLLIERAMRTWTETAAGTMTLALAAGNERAAIRIRFLRSRDVYGETQPVVDRRTGLIAAADVVINADAPGDAPGDSMSQQIVIYLTALHELGHALGLPHTDNVADIMYSFRRPDDGERYFGAYRRKLGTAADIGSRSATGLSPADVAALRALYHH